MIILLISTNRDLYRQLEAIVRDLPGPQSTIYWGRHDDGDEAADFFIWDFQPGMNSPSTMVANRLQNHLFVVDRRSLPAFRQAVPFPEAMVLLKPVASASLRAFLVQAMIATDPGLFGQGGREIDKVRSDRDAILECLLETNSKLQEYDQERTNFLARAIHDFRAPLTAITGYCGLLLGEQLGEITESQREVLERMRRSAGRLSRMTSAMYELSLGSQMSLGRLAHQDEMRQCIEQAIYEVTPAASEMNIAIRPDIVPPSVPLSLDASHLERVLVNLLENALKFTPEGGEIQVQAYPYFWERRSVRDIRWRSSDRRHEEHSAPNAYRVDIKDNGPGIPPQQLDRIFDEYTTYAGSRDRSGGGLGLAICRLIMNQHLGAVWAENLSPTGAMFSFVLPMDPGEAQSGKPASLADHSWAEQKDILCR